MAEQIELIRGHGARSVDQLKGDPLIQAATLHWLLIIGEAANRVSAELRRQHPEVAWREIVDFRNLVVHGYDYVKLERVWEVVEADLPDLERQVRAILAELG